MNKNLFATKLSPHQTTAMVEEYNKYIEETATNLVRADPDCRDEKQFQSRAEQDVQWSSWVVGISKRNFAFHLACSAVNVNHTIGAVRPSESQATVAIAKQIAKRCLEIADKARPAYYKLRFKAQRRWLTAGDLDLSDNESEWMGPGMGKAAVEDIVRKFYRSYSVIGIDPPAVEAIGFGSDGLLIEEFTVLNEE